MDKLRLRKVISPLSYNEEVVEARSQPSLNDSESSFLPSYTSTCIVSVGLCISLTCEIPDLMYCVFFDS